MEEKGLREYFREIADAIRERTGIQGPIPAVEFPARIRRIGAPVEMPAVGTTLEKCSWEQISAVARAGRGTEFWRVGDTKTLSVDGDEYKVQIIGFDHDEVTDPDSYGREKAGITFQFGLAGTGNQGVYKTPYPYNETKTNSGGWNKCTMRTAVMPAIKALLPGDLQGVLTAVNKKSTRGDKITALDTSSDELFLFCITEVAEFGANLGYGDFSGEGSMYQYYRENLKSNPNIRSRFFNGEKVGWWSRSPDQYTNYTSFYFRATEGAASYGDADKDFYVSFGFCL